MINTIEWIFLSGELLALLSAPSVLLGRRGRPTAALSWLMCMLALPLLGVVVWWLFGRAGMRKPKRKRSASAIAFANLRMHDQNADALLHTKMPAASRQAVFRHHNNNIQLLINGEKAFSAMEAAIQNATKRIHAVYYIWQNDSTGRKLRDLLAEKARSGVEVRLLVDHLGSTYFRGKFVEPLRQAGVRFSYFMSPKIFPFGRPTIHFRNHRKIMVIDHELAFTGGMNVGDEYALVWEDIMLQLSGPAVRTLEEIFLDDWYFTTNEYVEAPEHHAKSSSVNNKHDTTCTVVASGPDDSQPWMHDAFFRGIVRARHRIWIATPYFIPSEPIIAALRTAAGRGVDVRILVPRKTDLRLVRWASRAYYTGLMSVGARIFEYLPGMLHAKIFVVDEQFSTVGTANVDPRSFRLNFEVGCFLESPEIADQLAAWYEEKIQNAEEVCLEDLRRQPKIHALIESAAHLLSPIL